MDQMTIPEPLWAQFDRDEAIAGFVSRFSRPEEV